MYTQGDSDYRAKGRGALRRKELRKIAAQVWRDSGEETDEEIEDEEEGMIESDDELPQIQEALLAVDGDLGDEGGFIQM